MITELCWQAVAMPAGAHMQSLPWVVRCSLAGSHTCWAFRAHRARISAMDVLLGQQQSQSTGASQCAGLRQFIRPPWKEGMGSKPA